MLPYNIRTMTGHEVLVAAINAANPRVNLEPSKVRFTDLRFMPTETRPGLTQIRMWVTGYRGSSLIRFGRVDILTAFPDITTEIFEHVVSQEDLVARLNQTYVLNLGTDDVGMGTETVWEDGVVIYTLAAKPDSLVWHGEKTMNLVGMDIRLYEDMSVRYMENGEPRRIET